MFHLIVHITIVKEILAALLKYMEKMEPARIMA